MEHYFTNNQNLKSEFRTIEYVIAGEKIILTSDLGVFSKDKVDYGSHLLIDTYIKNGKENINLLDVGCGYGIIGITLAKIKEVNATLVDVNRRALHLAEINSKNNHVNVNLFESDVYSNVHGFYDVIITNPPIRAGKDVILNILLNAKGYLNENGELWFVMRKDQGAKSAIKKLESIMKVEVVNRSKGFYIIVAKNY